MQEAEHWFPAPRNGLNPPPGKDRKHGRPGAGALVLARLVWTNRVDIVPAVAVWYSHDRICIEWRANPGPGLASSGCPGTTFGHGSATHTETRPRHREFQMPRAPGEPTSTPPFTRGDLPERGDNGTG